MIEAAIRELTSSPTPAVPLPTSEQRLANLQALFEEIDLYQILAGKRNVTADTALRLSRYFGTSADFWMNLQSAYELDLARRRIGKAIEHIPQRIASAVEHGTLA